MTSKQTKKTKQKVKLFPQAKEKRTVSTTSGNDVLNSKEKHASNNVPVLTAKRKAFVREYSGQGKKKNALNATQSYLDVYNTKSNTCARVEGSRLLANTNVQMAIAELMNEKGYSKDVYIDLNHRNATQKENLPVSQRAIETGLKLHGELRTDTPQTQVNVALVIE